MNSRLARSQTRVSVKKTTTVTVPSEQIEEILRQHFQMPKAGVSFECSGCEFLCEATLTLVTVEEGPGDD